MQLIWGWIGFSPLEWSIPVPKTYDCSSQALPTYYLVLEVMLSPCKWYYQVLGIANKKFNVNCDYSSIEMPNETKFYSCIVELLCSEIMHAMWKPARFKYVYVACSIYVLFITIPHSYALYWAYGDTLLTHSNALGILPKSNARDTALIFMIIHQVINVWMSLQNLFVFELFIKLIEISRVIDVYSLWVSELCMM